MELKFRTLYPTEVEVRVAMVKSSGCQLLLYKTARVDAKVLDEVVGPMNWKVDYRDIKNNMYAGISIYDDTKKEWITKWNCGVESFSEKEKGEASDALKRSGFTWGIGVELYETPFIWVKLDSTETETYNNKLKLKAGINFVVKEIESSEDKKVTKLLIEDTKGNVRYTFGSNTKATTPKASPKTTPSVETPKPSVEVEKQEPLNIDTSSPLLSKEELHLISDTPVLLEYMKNALNGKKYKDFDDINKQEIAELMREKMKGLGIIK